MSSNNNLVVMNKLETDKGGVRLTSLNALENAILAYGKLHRETIGNPYQWFALRLGYKGINTIYYWFQRRDDSKIKLTDVKQIYSIIRQELPAEASILMDHVNGDLWG